MNAKPVFFLIALMALCFKTFAQNPPEEFFNGLKLVTTDRPAAKIQLLEAAKKAPEFHGTYHFLGVIYTNQHKPDSAIYYYKKSIALNAGNVNHTKEMTYARLINEYIYQKDFKNAYATGVEASNSYPDNRAILSALRDACLWSFYIGAKSLPASYISADAKDEYNVETINQEYLIVRFLRLNDNAVGVVSQALANKSNGPYDILTCQTYDKQPLTVNFKINWDMGKDFGGKPLPTQSFIDDKSKPAYERLGAMLHANAKTDVKAEIAKLN